MAELSALCDGLILCNNLNYSAVDIQINAKTIVALLSNPSYSNGFTMPIIDDCKQLISWIPQVQIEHCYYEANSYADFLANMGSSQTREFVSYIDPPVGLEELISSDSDGMYHNRLLFELSLPP